MSCEEGYFLNPTSFLCIERANKDTACVLYAQNADECQTCKSNYFLAPDKRGCEPNPSGIMGCHRYLNATKCLQCVSAKFLNSTGCFEVLEVNRVANCAFYKSEKTCDVCDTGYVSVSGQCSEILAVDCLTAKDPNTCLTCSVGYGLKPESGKTNCVAKEDFNCIISSNVYPFKCTVCDAGYYVKSDGLCDAVGTTIDECSVYATADACSKCRQGFVLATNKKTCSEDSSFLSLVDDNCNSYSLSNTAICTVCKPGYIFEGENCVLCKNNTIAQGCHSCDPFDESKCLMCTHRYY